jgi:hypothetical protein
MDRKDLATGLHADGTDDLTGPEGLYSWGYNSSLAPLQTAKGVVLFVLLVECSAQVAALARSRVTSQVVENIG